jgi:hypothetical protein
MKHFAQPSGKHSIHPNSSVLFPLLLDSDIPQKVTLKHAGKEMDGRRTYFRNTWNL